MCAVQPLNTVDRQSIFRIARKIGLFYAHAIRHFGYFARFRAVALHFGYILAISAKARK